MSYPFKMKSPLDSSEKDEFNPTVSFLFSSNKDKKKKPKKEKKSNKKIVYDIPSNSKEIFRYVAVKL